MAAEERDWHWEEVKAAIRMRGMTLQALAERLGYSKAAVAIVPHQPWARVEAGIAAFLSLRPEQIWPSRYDAAGAPLRRRRSGATKRRPAIAAATPQKQG